MSQERAIPDDQSSPERIADTGSWSGQDVIKGETTLQALEERTVQLKEANEALLSANAELLEAKEHSLQNADYLQAVLNNSPAAIGFIKAVFDHPRPLQGDPLTDRIVDYRLVALNEKFARLVGEHIRQLIGQSATRLADVLWQGDTYASFYRIIVDDAAVYEEREYDKDGQPGWQSISATKYDGGVVLTSLDITELRQMQLQRDAMRQQAAHSEKVTAQLAILRQQLSHRGESLRTTSHDLRSSMGVIQGAAQLLQYAESDEDRVHIVGMLNRNVGAMTQLLTELVNTLPIETDEQPDGNPLGSNPSFL